MNFLARYFAKLVDTGAIRLPFDRMKPCLLYADDALFFIKPEIQQLQTFKIALTVFQNVSGLATNQHKLELLIADPKLQNAAQLPTILGCGMAEFPFTYLGLPLSNERLPKTAFLPLIHRINVRLAGWAAKHLSIADRLVLLNAVLSTLPSYFMTVLRLPKWVIQQIDKTRRRFLWHGVSQNACKMSLANWELVCRPKEYGGLGIIDLSAFNKALLIKWIWYWQKPEQRMWKPIFQGSRLSDNFVPATTLFTAAQSHDLWKAGVTHIYGQGDHISLLNHNLGFGIMKYELPSLYTHALDVSIYLKEATQGPIGRLF